MLSFVLRSDSDENIVALSVPVAGLKYNSVDDTYVAVGDPVVTSDIIG